MEKNSSRYAHTIDHGTIVDKASKRTRNIDEGDQQPVIPVKTLTGVTLNSDCSTATIPISIAGSSGLTRTSSVSSSSNDNTRTNGGSDKGKGATGVTASSRVYEQLPFFEKLDLRPCKRQKTVFGSSQHKYQQQQQHASSSSSSSRPVPSSPSSSQEAAAAAAAAIPSSPPVPSSSSLRQVPTVIDLTLDDDDDEPALALPPPTRSRLFKRTSTKGDNAKRTKNITINYLNPFGGSNSDDSDSSSKDGATAAPVPMQDRRSDLRGKKAQVNQTQQRQSLYDDNEDELDELFEEEEEAADVQKDVKILKTTNTTTTSKHGRVIAEPDDDDDVNGSDGILEDAVEEQENQEKFDEEGDEELESIRMTHGTPKKSHDVVPYEVDELRSSQESDDRFDAMDDDNDNDNTPALPPPTAALSFEQSVYKEKEINGEKDKTIDTTLPTAPEPLKTNLNDPRDCEVSIDSPPLLPVHEQLGSAAPTPNLDGLISKENTDPAAAEKPPVTSKAIERDTITSVLTVAPEATTAQKPSTSPSAATAKETLSDEQTPERQYASTSPPSTTLSSFSSTPLSDDAVHSCEEGSRNQSDPTSLANTANMKNLTGPEHIDEEAGDDDNDDFYSAEQADSPLSDEFVTAQPNRSSSVEGVETDLDYKRMSRHKLTTGYVYDVVMSLHAQLGHAGDDDDPHPEDPRRIYSIYKCMEENGLLNNCTKIPIRQATKAEVLATHDPRYYQTLRQTEGMSRKELEKQARQYNSIYMNAHSHESALFSAGGVIEACSAVVTDKVQNAFAIVRPPGHHAEFDTAMGFCLMNNVAIAARYCKEHFPFVERILILDWDIHFGNYKTKAMHDRERTHDILDTDSGNGTQQLTSSDGDILYISLHRYEKGTFYPQDKHGRHAYVGRGKGRGRTVNIPWPDSGMTDGDYLYAFRQIVMPIAMEFDPSLVIVSAGFDAAAGDQIGECHVTPAGYGQMTHMLKSLANGRVVLALEGGYNLESIAKSAYACMSVLVGESPEIPTLLTPSPECVETVQKVKQVQSQYWDTLKY